MANLFLDLVAQMVTEMDQDFERKLINRVLRIPCLYATDRPEFSDRTEKYFAWIKVARLLKKSVTECKSKWQNLLQTYMVHYNSSEGGENSAKLDGWPHYQLLNLIEDYIVKGCYDPAFLEHPTAVQRGLLLSELLKHRSILVDLEGTDERRERIWTKIADSLNEDSYGVQMSVDQWKKYWWEMKQEVIHLQSQTIGTEADSSKYSDEDLEILKFCGVSSSGSISFITGALNSDLEFGENMWTKPIKKCRKCNNFLDGSYLWFKVYCANCSSLPTKTCELCSFSNPETQTFTIKEWSISARELLPPNLQCYNEVSICASCIMPLKEKASELWKICRFCELHYKNLENIFQPAQDCLRQSFEETTGVQFMQEDGLPAYICKMCKIQMQQFNNFYSKFKRVNNRLLQIQGIKFIGDTSQLRNNIIPVINKSPIPEQESEQNSNPEEKFDPEISPQSIVPVSDIHIDDIKSEPSSIESSPSQIQPQRILIKNVSSLASMALTPSSPKQMIPSKVLNIGTMSPSTNTLHSPSSTVTFSMSSITGATVTKQIRTPSTPVSPNISVKNTSPNSMIQYLPSGQTALPRTLILKKDPKGILISPNNLIKATLIKNKPISQKKTNPKSTLVVSNMKNGKQVLIPKETPYRRIQVSRPAVFKISEIVENEKEEDEIPAFCIAKTHSSPTASSTPQIVQVVGKNDKSETVTQLAKPTNTGAINQLAKQTNAGAINQLAKQTNAGAISLLNTSKIAVSASFPPKSSTCSIIHSAKNPPKQMKLIRSDGSIAYLKAVPKNTGIPILPSTGYRIQNAVVNANSELTNKDDAEGSTSNTYDCNKTLIERLTRPQLTISRKILAQASEGSRYSMAPKQHVEIMQIPRKCPSLAPKPEDSQTEAPSHEEQKPDPILIPDSDDEQEAGTTPSKRLPEAAKSCNQTVPQKVFIVKGKSSTNSALEGRFFTGAIKRHLDPTECLPSSSLSQYSQVDSKTVSSQLPFQLLPPNKRSRKFWGNIDEFQVPMAQKKSPQKDAALSPKRSVTIQVSCNPGGSVPSTNTLDKPPSINIRSDSLYDANTQVPKLDRVKVEQEEPVNFIYPDLYDIQNLPLSIPSYITQTDIAPDVVSDYGYSYPAQQAFDPENSNPVLQNPQPDGSIRIKQEIDSDQISPYCNINQTSEPVIQTANIADPASSAIANFKIKEFSILLRRCSLKRWQKYLHNEHLKSQS